MPPRLNKRQQREQQELKSLAVSKKDAIEDEIESGDEESISAQKLGSGFAALGPEIQDDDSESEESTSHAKEAAKKKKKKKKKKSAAAASTEVTPEPSTPATDRPPKQKKAKKAKQKAQEDERDDIDKALAELSLKFPGASPNPSNSPTSTRASTAFFTLLSISLANLDSEAEMRRFFGAKIVSSAKAASATAGPSRRRPVATRSNLTNPQSSWWPATLRQGLSLRPLSDQELADRRKRHGCTVEVPGEKHWTVEYSKKYKGVTKSFIHMVMSGDPEGFSQLLKVFPYHADTLLQLSEVYSHREEHATAADFIDRSLFTYERAFVGAFNLTMGINRLDFDHVENRPFYLALHRQVADLQRRGCVRSSFEFGKLLFSLDPHSDPHGSLLHLDFLAIKSGQAQWILDMWNAYGEKNVIVASKGFNVRAVPGWNYARALALFTIENTKHDIEHEQSTAMLTEAIQRFPSVVPILADKADISLSPDIRGSNLFRIRLDANSLSSESESVLHLLSHLYAQRSNSLWKAKATAKWFADTVKSTFASPSFPRNSTPSPPADFRALFSAKRLTYSIYRHVLVLESSYRALFSFFPSSVVSALQLACDPLPPPTRVTEYDQTFFAGAEDPFAHTSRSRKQIDRLLERMIPDPGFRRQLQGFFEAHPNFAQRFPGGIVQFAQLAAELPEDALEDLFAAELAAEPGVHLQGEGGGGQVMPGGLFGDVDDEPPALGEEDLDDVEDRDGDEEEDAEEEGEQGEQEAVATLPVRIWQNVLSRFWGGGEATEEDPQGS
ncbi:hypothetical protein EUX98_g2009 [Antrodiella citrinella]|uniref:Uncharacterized protein n=1 Tax=Antrodiella citrinella TaxID=2447956 RepID=A0A4S4N8D2_9APHY|nr:hypothetical protein EUX98_g2009 [Antrodiella citrinella]